MSESRIADDTPSRNAIPSLGATVISLIWKKAEIDGDAQKPQTISYRILL